MKNLYIRIAKTGSSSISSILKPNTDELIPTLANLETFNKTEYEEKFTIVRNPYDRMVSSYHSLCNGEGTSAMIHNLRSEINAGLSFSGFVKKIIDYRNRHEEIGLPKTKNIHMYPWHDAEGRQINSHRLPYETHWLLSHTEAMTDAIEFFTPLESMTKVVKLEELSEVVNDLSNILDLNAGVPNLNVSSKRKNYKEYYDDETKKLVATMYEKDLDNFKYTL